MRNEVDMRPLMASFPTGVTVVTTLDGERRPWGMTCTSLCSVALEPPTLLVCLRLGSPTLAAITTVGSFAVNLLHDSARPAAELFAAPVPDRFERIAWRHDDGCGGPHLVEAAHTVADCRVSGSSVVGDHAVVLGAVERVTQWPRPRPLLYGLRRYASWPAAVESEEYYFDFVS